jgi:hypothetical protein
MRRLLSLLFLVVSLISVPAFADGLTLFANSGAGDNFGYVSGSLHLSGGTDPYFLYAGGYPAGMTVGGGGTLYLYSTVIPVNGVSLEFFFNPGSIFMTTIQLPTNGRDFIAPVDISFEATGFNFDTEQTISVSGGGSGWIGFSYSNGYYYPSDFVQGPPPKVVPEPATLGLIGTGIIGILASARKRLKRPRM